MKNLDISYKHSVQSPVYVLCLDLCLKLVHQLVLDLISCE